jgi:hypothetical protein
MKYRFQISYIPFCETNNPEKEHCHSFLTMTVERCAHETVPFDVVRQQVACELEEQHYRILSIEGETIE